MMTKTEIVYFVGGNIEKYMKLGGQYLIQWEMIKRAMQNKCARYNFYGIAPNIDTHPENYGVYGFKKGFSGKVVQLIGEYELPIDKKKYYTMKIFEKLRRLI